MSRPAGPFGATTARSWRVPEIGEVMAISKPQPEAAGSADTAPADDRLADQAAPLDALLVDAALGTFRVRPYSTQPGSAGGHVDEATVVALEGDRHHCGRPVPVLGHDQVRLPGPG